ncbi:glycosyltransferase family 61 protein [Rapidithrix thailandica]|uniref:Glycosyltransferase family 61 protein n=1 Tax=Rapidithrix thailandica TaxID=413964 RepID=A0AAW9RY13_9BACT
MSMKLKKITFENPLKTYVYLPLSPLKTMVSRFLRHMPVSSSVIGPPKNYLATVKEYLAAFTQPAKIYTEVYRGSFLVKPYKRSLDDLNQPGQEEQTREYNTFLLSLEAGRYSSVHNCVITAQDKLLSEVSSYPDDGLKHGVFKALKISPVKKLSGKAFLLTGQGDANYYHWLLQIIPKLHLLKAAGKDINSFDHILLHRHDLPFIDFLLKYFEVDQHKLVNLLEHRHIQADELVVTSPLWKPEPWAVDFLRSSFLKKNNRKTPARKLFISRKMAKHRKILNEEEVQKVLDKYGFEPICLEEFSLLEQVELMASAQYVLGPHGAGFSNIVFCPKNATIIEIRAKNHQDYIMDCFNDLSSIIGMDHYLLESETSTETDVNEGTDDMWVDVTKLEALLHSLNLK